MADEEEQPEPVEQTEIGPGKSDNSWTVTTSRMLIQFYRENRILWDKNHKDYGKKQLQKRALMPLVAKLERCNVPKGEEEIKKRWHNIRTSALRYFKKYSSENGAEIKWAYWDNMAFLREHLAHEGEQEPDPWSTEETEMLISFFQQSECLWNHNSPLYHENTHNKDLLYDVLAKELNDKYDTAQIKKKWKELEKKFREEHFKASKKPSGSGTDEIYKPTFVFYDQLQFLTVICEADEIDSIEHVSNLNPRKKSKLEIHENRENRKLELFSQAVQAMKETPGSTRMQCTGNKENTEAMAFGNYVGITLSKLSKRKFRQAKKCIGDILYNIEESEDHLSSSTTSVHESHSDRYSHVSTPSSFETFHSLTPSENGTSERCNDFYNPVLRYPHLFPSS